MSEQDTRRKLANAIRMLAVEAVQKAHSGHPGMPMGMADIAEVLWNDFLKHNPQDPHWPNRDRFVLSNGHGSMLLYAALHLSGYDLPMEELQRFRQLHSKTPGHPELGDTPGVETTTGPLGQGLANAVGMALAESLMSKAFNRPGFDVIDHDTYCFVGDGCLMEGISHEVASLAGTLGLGRLTVFWDDNQISIDGDVSGWFRDNTPERFRAYGWHVIAGIDGQDAEAVKKAIIAARKIKDKPSLLCCRTVIGWGAPNLAGTAKMHGAPAGEAEIALIRKQLNWPYPPFEIPQAVYQGWDAKVQGQARQAAWNELWSRYEAAHPDLAQELSRRWQRTLPQGWQEASNALCKKWCKTGPKMATRQASQKILERLLSVLPELFGGSADLSESNLTYCSEWHHTVKPHAIQGNYLFYGVREFGMTAIMNGVALYGGLIPYGGTFLTFSDYARSAVRMAAIMRQPVILVYTHDSIGLGEDGPTHQPIEHLSALRLIPGLRVWRPADAVETAVAWQQAVAWSHGPSALALSRQACPPVVQDEALMANIAKGAYVLWESAQHPVQAILMGTGSEVAIAMQAAQQLEAVGCGVRVVSMPCWEAFEAQPEAYQESVLPNRLVIRTAVEAGATQLWYRWVGSTGKVVGIDRYGLSAPGAQIFSDLGVTADAVFNATKGQWGPNQS